MFREKGKYNLSIFDRKESKRSQDKKKWGMVKRDDGSIPRIIRI